MKQRLNILTCVKALLFSLSILISPMVLATGGGDGDEPMPCDEALPFCSDESYDFPNVSGGVFDDIQAPSGPDYGCLMDQPNPIWYYMEIEESGPIQIDLYQSTGTNGSGLGLDVDFALWGPFSDYLSGCDEIMSGNLAPIQCSYSPDESETIGLGLTGGYGAGQSTPPAAQAGEVYVLLITNWDGASGYISFHQSNYGQTGAGSTNCDIVVPCNITEVSGEASECDPATNTFVLSGEVEFTDPPEGGTLVVEDCEGNVQTFNEPFSSPTVVTFHDLIADGQDCQISAYFIDSEGDTLCTKNSQVFSKPENCVCEGSDMVAESVIPTNPSCADGCDGQIEATVTGGEGTITFVWTDGNGNAVGSDENIALDLCAGAYSYVATDELGCTVSGNATLINPAAEDSSFVLTDFCANETNQATDIGSPGGVFSIVAPLNDGAEINPETGEITNAVGGTTYTVQYETPNCQLISTQDVTAHAYPTIDVEANTTEGQPVLTVVFENNAVGNNSFNWDFDDGTAFANNDEVVDHDFNHAGEYNVVITATSENDCQSTDEILIFVYNPDMEYEFPNVFTPNGDHQNDQFKLVHAANIQALNIVIVNRWGNVVYESETVDFEWNGKVKNTGADCAEGTYFYNVKLTNWDGEERQEHGYIHLLRKK